MRVSGVLLLSALAIGCASSSPASPSAPSDDSLLVSRLLAIEHPAFRSDGAFDALGEYKAWESLYARLRTHAGDPDRSDEGPMKLFLLAGAIARLQLDAGTTESFTTDLMPIYEAQPGRVLRALSQAPFLVPSTCHFLGAFFGFEDRNAGGKPAFLAAESARIRAGLPRDLAEECIAAIEAGE